jgi:uncharacterized membrane protein
MLLQYTSEDYKANGRSAAKVGLWISFVACCYPFLAVAFSRVHYALTSIQLSKKTDAVIGLLLPFLVCVMCMLSLYLSLRGERVSRIAGIVFSVAGIALNVLFFIAWGISD